MEEAFTQDHLAHASLVTQEANGKHVAFQLLLVHAEDQLMSAETTHLFSQAFIDLYEQNQASVD